MKAIFLDIDGVVATPRSVRLSYLLGRRPDTQWYDLIALHHLGRLVRGTGARVVLSSTWRDGLVMEDPVMKAVMDNLLGQLARAGAPVSGMTPFSKDGDRSAEIGAWLDENPCEAWVILDDLARFDARPDVTEGHLVLIEDSGGLRWRHYRRARRILG